MTFTSYVFILLFLPVSLLLYWRVFKQARPRMRFLVTINLLFYALGGLVYLPLLPGLTLATFWLARRQRAGLAIWLNALALIVFKYLDFGIQNVNTLSQAIGAPTAIPLLNLALPLGISFYVFKHIGYLIDVKQERYEPADDLLLFFTYATFFAQIPAGPISNYADTGDQLQNLPAALSREKMWQGFVFLSIGLAKKLLVADALGEVFFQEGLMGDAMIHAFVPAWLAVVTTGAHLYLDFSAYSDIALGIGALFGITLPANFNNPFLASNPRQFWDRWHMSVTMWFRHYLFFPISLSLLRRWGAKRVAWVQPVATMATMILIGLWHGARWTYFWWGAYNGLMLIAHSWFEKRKIRLWPDFLNHAAFLFFLLMGMGIFAAPSMNVVITQLWPSMLQVEPLRTAQAQAIKEIFSAPTFLALFSMLAIIATGKAEAANHLNSRNRVVAVLLGILLILAVMSMGQAIDFVYVQF